MSENFGNKEEVLDASSLLISETNSKGIVTFANNSFLEIAGYTKEELIGQPHNFVRHPFMPKAAFEDLWSTIKDGKIWDGIVINQTKSGGYYWVKANVYKTQNPDGSVRYMSVRIKPSKEEIDAVIKLYPTL